MIARKLYSANNCEENCTHTMIARRTGFFRNSDRTVPWTGALERAVKYKKYYPIIINIIIFNTGAIDKAVKYGSC